MAVGYICHGYELFPGDTCPECKLPASPERDGAWPEGRPLTLFGVAVLRGRVAEAEAAAAVADLKANVAKGDADRAQARSVELLQKIVTSGHCPECAMGGKVQPFELHSDHATCPACNCRFEADLDTFLNPPLTAAEAEAAKDRGEVVHFATVTDAPVPAACGLDLAPPMGGYGPMVTSVAADVTCPDCQRAMVVH